MQVIRASLETLWDFWQHGVLPHIGMNSATYIVLGAATGATSLQLDMAGSTLFLQM